MSNSGTTVPLGLHRGRELERRDTMTSPKIRQVQPLREGARGKEQNSMKAIVQDEYGSPDVLKLRDIDIPEISDDEVLVRVHAAGVGRDVWHVMAGLPYPIRLAGYGLRAPKNPVIR